MTNRGCVMNIQRGGDSMISNDS